MADIEKVIKGLECCRIDENRHINCADCPYYTDDDKGQMWCSNEINNDALKLLKEQQAEIDRLKGKQPKKKQIWVIKKGNKYLHSYRAGRKSWTTKGSGISIWNSADKSTAEFFASAVDGIVVEWDGEQK